MSDTPLFVLLLEDDEGYARLTEAVLARAAPGRFAVVRVERLADALALLRSERFDVVLSDLGLPDSSGLAAVQAIIAQSPALPLVVLTGLHDDDLGSEAIHHGAQDYLEKQEANGQSIARSLTYAIERKRLEMALRAANETLEQRVSDRVRELDIANARLRESVARHEAITRTAADAIITADEQGIIRSWNGAAERIFGYTETESLGRPLELLMPQRFREAHRAGIRRVLADGEHRVLGTTAEMIGLTKAGQELPLELSLAQWATAKGRFFTGIVRDVTERKRAELSLRRQKDLYDVLSQTNHTIVGCADREDLFRKVCRIAVEHGRFRFAWIGLIDDDKRLKPVARYGDDQGYVEQLAISVDESDPAGRGYTARALRNGTPAVVNDFDAPQIRLLRREAALRAGARAYGTFPLRLGGAVVGAINLYSEHPGYFTDDLLSTLEETATAVSFALDNLERETDRVRAVRALHDSERLLRESQMIAGLGSYVLDIPSGMWTSSSVLDDIFGIDGRFERSVAGWLSLIVPQWRKTMSDYLAEQVLGKRMRFDREYPIVRRSDGQLRWVHGLGEVEFDSEDRPSRMIGTISDVTERKRAEEKTMHQLDELRRWQEVTLGREGRTIELKREVNDLLGRLGEPARYPSVEGEAKGIEIR